MSKSCPAQMQFVSGQLSVASVALRAESCLPSEDVEAPTWNLGARRAPRREVFETVKNHEGYGNQWKAYESSISYTGLQHPWMYHMLYIAF